MHQSQMVKFQLMVSIFFRNDTDVHGGGVALYVKQSLKPDTVSDLQHRW